jgi:60 kDa SS-A/Ro ribonucleoprotein
MKNAYTGIRTRPVKLEKSTTPQTQVIPGYENSMSANNAGGQSFVTEDFTRLTRWLICGSEGGSYYVGEKQLTLENVSCLDRCLAQDGMGVINLIVEISTQGRALKQDPLLFALARAASVGDSTPTPEQAAVRKHALMMMPRVARTATMLFHFVNFYQQFRGWSRGSRSAVAAWYTGMPVGKLAQQAWKYKSRDGWDHKDVLRLSHAKATDGFASAERSEIFKYLANPDESVLKKGLDGVATLDIMDADRFAVSMENEQSRALRQIAAAEELLHIDPTEKGAVSKAVSLILDYRLEREAVPTGLLNEVRVWDALSTTMGLEALLRNFNKMTIVGLLAPLSDGSKRIIDKLGSMEDLKAARVHPMRVLIAAKQYAAGRGQDRGGRTPLTWTPNQRVIDALDAAFYLAFGTVVPTGKKVLAAADVSGSMSGGDVMGINGFTPLMCSAAMILVLLNTEPNSHAIGFDSAGYGRGGLTSTVPGCYELPLTPSMRVDQVLEVMSRHRGGATDTSLPIQYAMKKNMDVDAIATYTDGETFAGRVQPAESLAQYRKKVGHRVRAINLMTTANHVSVQDTKDQDVFEIAGFDSAVPGLISDFLGDKL